MDSLRSPKFIAWKLGIVSGVALGALPMLGAEALAAAVVPSDTLQLVGGTNGTTQQLFEGSESATLSDSEPFNEQSQNIFGTRTIVLTEPGTSNISDIVTANLTAASGEFAFNLTVTLQSDRETPLTTTFDQSIPETGGVQNLGPAFSNLFDLNNQLPAINVSSDVSDTSVPEPGSLGLLGAGLASLAFARRRRKA